MGVAINPSYIKDCLAKNSDPLNFVEQCLAETIAPPVCVCVFFVVVVVFCCCCCIVEPSHTFFPLFSSPPFSSSNCMSESALKRHGFFRSSGNLNGLSTKS